MINDTQVGDERDYVCVVKAGPMGASEATSRVRVFSECPQHYPEERGWTGGGGGSEKTLLT